MIHRITVNTHGRNVNVIRLGTQVHYVVRIGCAVGVKEMPRDNICMYMVHVCFMSVVVTMWGSVGMLAV